MGAFTGPFTRRHALAAGFAPAEVRQLTDSGEWVRMRRGVYVPRSALGQSAGDPSRRHAIDVAALLLALGHRAVAAGTSAARILELEMLTEPPHELVMATDDPRVPCRRRDGYIIHNADLPKPHITTRHDVPITTTARTVLDLARTWPLADAVAVADSALRRRQTSIEELEAVLSDCRGWSGIDRAHTAVRLADPLAESVLESLSRVAMWQEGLPRPRTQVLIGTARVDFLWDKVRVIGESDGLGKYEPGDGRSPRDVVRAEKRREERLIDAGYEIVRWGWSDARNAPRLAARLRAAFARGLARQRGQAAS